MTSTIRYIFGWYLGSLVWPSVNDFQWSWLPFIQHDWKPTWSLSSVNQVVMKQLLDSLESSQWYWWILWRGRYSRRVGDPVEKLLLTFYYIFCWLKGRCCCCRAVVPNRTSQFDGNQSFFHKRKTGLNFDVPIRKCKSLLAKSQIMQMGSQEKSEKVRAYW